MDSVDLFACLKNGLLSRQVRCIAVVSTLLGTNQAENRQLVFGRRIRDFYVDQEPVHLRLWQWVGAFLFNGVLCGEYQKQVGQFVCRSGDSDLAFFHGLKQCGLYFCRRSIDFVGKNQVAEDRPRLKIKVTRLFTIDFRAGDVRWQQVGRELHTTEFAFDQARECLDRSRLRRAGQTFHEHVSVREQCDHQPFDDRLLSNDGRVHGVGDSEDGLVWRCHEGSFVQGPKWEHRPGRSAQQTHLPIHSETNTSFEFNRCPGSLLPSKIWRNRVTRSLETCTVCLRTTHSTCSVRCGVVKEPR